MEIDGKVESVLVTTNMSALPCIIIFKAIVNLFSNGKKDLNSI